MHSFTCTLFLYIYLVLSVIKNTESQRTESLYATARFVESTLTPLKTSILQELNYGSQRHPLLFFLCDSTHFHM